jgi:hypothetical protein
MEYTARIFKRYVGGYALVFYYGGNSVLYKMLNERLDYIEITRDIELGLKNLHLTSSTKKSFDEQYAPMHLITIYNETN